MRGAGEPDVLVERDGPLAVLRLNRPEARNAIHGSLFGDLLRATEAADGDDAARAIVTTGVGPTYCVGADRAALAAVAEAGAADLHVDGLAWLGGDLGLHPAPGGSPDPRGLGQWAARFLAVDTPTVAALNGGAGGGGMALALLHDWRVAAAGARVSLGFAALGVPPELGSSWLLPRLVGPRVAFDLLTRRAPVPVEEALELGLVDAVVAPGDVLDAARARALELAALPPQAFAATKRLLLAAGDATRDEQLQAEWEAQVALFADPRVAGSLRASLAQANDRLPSAP